jgi:hypothetical protein
MLQSRLNSAPIVDKAFVTTLLQFPERLRGLSQRLGTVNLVEFARVRLNFDSVHYRASLVVVSKQT